MTNRSLVAGAGALRGGWRAAAVVMAAVLVLAGGAHFIGGRLSAASESLIGYVDVSRIIDEYLAPLLNEPLARETARLQAEFDQRAQSLSEAERQELFLQYQA